MILGQPPDVTCFPCTYRLLFTIRCRTCRARLLWFPENLSGCGRSKQLEAPKPRAARLHGETQRSGVTWQPSTAVERPVQPHEPARPQGADCEKRGGGAGVFLEPPHRGGPSAHIPQVVMVTTHITSRQHLTSLFYLYIMPARIWLFNGHVNETPSFTNECIFARSVCSKL